MKLWENLPWIPNKFFTINYKIPKTALSKSKSRISFRGPSIWNDFLQNFEKETESLPLIKAISVVSSQHLLTKRSLMAKPELLSASPSSFQKPIWVLLFTIRKNICAVYLYVCNIWRLWGKYIWSYKKCKDNWNLMETGTIFEQKCFYEEVVYDMILYDVTK